MSSIKLSTLMAETRSGIDPTKFADEKFELFSIPSYDNGTPEYLFGREIGSAKQQVQNGDVLISKIVPHIRRSWVVTQAKGFRQIASGEWIVFRSPLIHPAYFRHYLLSDTFHRRFMTTVSGVGGSLLRAKPKRVGEFSIQLPSLSEQKRIAAILDKADEIRKKRELAIKKLDLLEQSQFEAMFGTQGRCQKHRLMLKSIYDFQEGPGVRKSQFTSKGVKLLNVGNIRPEGTLDLNRTTRFISAAEAFGKYSHFLCEVGDFVIASSGISIESDGLLKTRGAFVEECHLPLCMNTSTIRFKAKQMASLRFLKGWLNSLEFRRQITRLVTGSAQKNFGPTHLSQLEISVPTEQDQLQWAEISESIERQRQRYRVASKQTSAVSCAIRDAVFSD